MDDQIEQNLRKTLDQSLTEGADSIFTGDQRGSYPPGQMIDNRFRIIRELGRGGTGTVYQVEQILLRKEYAMKVLDPIQVSDEAWRRFQKEAQAAGLLDHAGFVKVHDFGIDNQIPFFTMDLVSGDTLSQRLRQKGPMSVGEALPIFIQLCFALDYAHSKGVIHRDLKPSNISLVKSDTPGGDQVKILDFGIAKLVGLDTTSLTQVGSVFGTPFYMSPEQCMGQPVDPRSDIYSLGCVFFEMLAGAPPFTSENALALMMQHQSETPPSLKEVSMGSQFPATLEAVIRKMLSKKPDDRYQRLVDTANDLIDLQQGKKPAVSVPKWVEASGAPKKFSTVWAAAVVCMMLVIAGGAFYFLHMQPGKENVVPPQGLAETNSTNSVTSASTSSPDSINSVSGKPDDQTVDDVMMANQYWSINDKRGRIFYRIFKFPKKPLVGEISYSKFPTGKIVTVPAVGDIPVAFNPGQPMLALLNLDWTMCSTSPQLLKKFRPDEVGALTFTDNDRRKAATENDIFDNTMVFVDNLKSIYSVDLPRPVTDACLEHLAKLPNLKYLNVAETNITGGALKNLPNLPGFKVLKISSIKDARLIFPALRHANQLEQLNAIGDGIQDSDLKYLSGLPSVEGLALGANPKITDAGLTYLANLPKLKRLGLGGCTITPKAIATLSKMKIGDFVALNLNNWSKADVDNLLKAVKYDVRNYNEKSKTFDSIRNPPSNSGISNENENRRPKDPEDYGN